MRGCIWLLTSTLGMVAYSAAAAQGSPATVPGQGAIEKELVALERGSWVAWKARDGRFFQTFLADDHVDVSGSGISRKPEIVGFVGSPACVVASYQLDSIAVRVFDAHAAVLVYRVKQDTKCGGVPVPSPAWASSTYLKRGGKWQNVIFQQTPVSQ